MAHNSGTGASCGGMASARGHQDASPPSNKLCRSRLHYGSRKRSLQAVFGALAVLATAALLRLNGGGRLVVLEGKSGGWSTRAGGWIENRGSSSRQRLSGSGGGVRVGGGGGSGGLPSWAPPPTPPGPTGQDFGGGGGGGGGSQVLALEEGLRGCWFTASVVASAPDKVSRSLSMTN